MFKHSSLILWNRDFLKSQLVIDFWILYLLFIFCPFPPLEVVSLLSLTVLYGEFHLWAFMYLKIVKFYIWALYIIIHYIHICCSITLCFEIWSLYPLYHPITCETISNLFLHCKWKTELILYLWPGMSGAVMKIFDHVLACILCYCSCCRKLV